MKWWAQLGLNQRPLRCQRSALPLSYAPFSFRLAPEGYGKQASLCDGKNPIDFIDQGAQMKRLGQDLGIRFLRFMIIERNHGEAGNKYQLRIWRLNADSAREL